MSGVHGQMLSHVVRRGVDAAQHHFSGLSQESMQKLQQDANAYDEAGPEMRVNPMEFLPVVITGVIIMLFIASVRYTLGEVIASLAMIESPSSTAIIEPKPPAYADEPDAPLEKESLLPAEADADKDVEITVINHKPITTKIRTSMSHLHRTGGFFARWRGLGVSIFYHAVHGMASNFLAGLVGFGIIGHSLTYIMTSLGLARLHMVWTHSMIAAPSKKSWYRRMVPRKQCKALVLPTVVFAAAQQATVILPIAVAFALGLPQQMSQDGSMQPTDAPHAHHGCALKALMAMRFIAVPLIALIVALAVLLPASVTLTRIEAALLPADEATIVPFDREAIMGGLDMQTRGACRAVFVQAWRSFDRAARLRLIKLYAKMFMLQVVIGVVGIMLMASEMALIGGDKLIVFTHSAGAKMQLAAIEAQNSGN